jgi:hypothetical protein
VALWRSLLSGAGCIALASILIVRLNLWKNLVKRP